MTTVTFALRIVLICAAVFVFIFVILNVRKSRMRIEDSLFWVAMSLLILFLSIFPQVGTLFSELLGFYAPVNFVFLFFIFVLFAKCFAMSRHASQLESKIKELAQQIAIDNLEHYERAHASRSLESKDSANID